MCRLSHHKGCSLERARPYMNEIHVLIFQHPLEEQRSIGLSPGMEALAIVYTFLYLASANGHNGPPCSPPPAKAGGYTLSPCSPIASLKPVGAQSTDGPPLNHLALVARGAHFSESLRTSPIREQDAGKESPPGHSTDHRLKHTHLFLGIKAYFVVWSFSLWGTLQVHHTSRGYRGLSRNTGCYLCMFTCLTPAHWYLPERSYPFIWSSDFCNVHLEDTSRSPGWEASRVYMRVS